VTAQQFNKLQQYIKYIWMNSLNTLTDITMSINSSTPNMFYNSNMDLTLTPENEYTIFLTNQTIYNSLYNYVNELDSLSYWSNMERISMYKEKIEEFTLYYLKWSDNVEFNITEKEYNDWKKQFILNIRKCSSLNLLNSDFLKVAKHFKNIYEDNTNIINNINDITKQ